ncbi:hypothetical protein GGR57DRAFT_500248 [Xylariaceae sp. FL1272]|nr:hypothetical protein GGR57DRAFT_500248 [Xylariaceae sp. FL1272]
MTGAPPETTKKFCFKLAYSMCGQKGVYREWHTTVEDYSSRALKYPSDRLPALAGIAKVVIIEYDDLSEWKPSPRCHVRRTKSHIAGLNPFGHLRLAFLEICASLLRTTLLMCVVNKDDPVGASDKYVVLCGDQELSVDADVALETCEVANRDGILEKSVRRSLVANTRAESGSPVFLLYLGQFKHSTHPRTAQSSGDIRNVIVSVAGVPLAYDDFLEVTMNDKQINIVARNLIYLLIFFVQNDARLAAEYLLHTWYSVLLTDVCYDLLRNTIRPMIEDICDKMEEKLESALAGHTWHFGHCSPRCRSNPRQLAQQKRRDVMLAPIRIDNMDQMLCNKSSPAEKQAAMRFREDGILVPFGHSRRDFTIPNPAFFASQEWLMLDWADPTGGWLWTSYLTFNAGPAKNDIYGQLYFYLPDLFASFHRKLRSMPIKFELLHVDAQTLPTSL